MAPGGGPTRTAGRLAAALLVVLASTAGREAQAQARFRKVYGSVSVGSTYSVLSVLQTGDGGYLASGNTGTLAFLLKLDEMTGATVFYRTYDLYSMPGLDEVPGGGFVLAGERVSFNDPAILRVDASGVPIWAKSYDVGFSEQGFYVVHPTPDGGYLASGIHTLKVDATGAPQWSKIHIGGGGNVNGSAITQDGGSVLTGEGQNGNTGQDYNLVVTRLDASGTPVWNRVYAEDQYDWGSDVKPTRDGGYIVTGWTRSFSTGRACFLLKLDAAGTPRFTFIYPGTMESACQSVAETADGYVATGIVDGSLLLLKTDGAGAVQWSRAYGGSTTGYAVKPTRDSGYVVAGVSGSSLTIVKTDATGDASTCLASDPALAAVPVVFRLGTNTTNGPTTWTPTPYSASTTSPALVTTSPCPTTCNATARLLLSDPDLCRGDTVTLDGSGSRATPCNGAPEYRFAGTNGFLRDWSAAATASDTPLVSTTYTLSIRCNDPPCSASDTGPPVTVYSPPTADAGPHAARCAGSSTPVTLGGAPTASGGTPPYDFTWMAVPPDPTLSCTSGPACANPTASPGTTTTYTVTVSDAGACSALSATTVVVSVPSAPPDIGNTLRLAKDVAAPPRDPTSLIAAWPPAGGSAVGYNLNRSDSRKFLPPFTVIAVPGTSVRLPAEVPTLPPLRLYRVTTLNCAGDESPI